mgnify:CR=1 FL=1
MLALVLGSGPWILFFGMAMVPMLVVRTVRRTRMRGIEQDLPLALELFATMGQAGLGLRRPGRSGNPLGRCPYLPYPLPA